MKSKIFSMVSSAALVLVAVSGADAGQRAGLSATGAAPVSASRFDRSDIRAAKPAKLLGSNGKAGANFVREKGVLGEQLYIVRLADEPVASYRGGIKNYAATSVEGDLKATPNAVSNRNARGVLDVNSAASRAYAGYLSTKQAEFKRDLDGKLGRATAQPYSYKFGFNGMALRMTQDEAAKAASLRGVYSVTRDRMDTIETDRGPTFIGAPGLWDGSESGFAGVMGEGMLIGIIDTGMNPSHPSFAEVGGDGYVHTNPYGDGVFHGACNDFPGMCNNKLVGMYHFLEAFGGTDPLTPPGDPISKDTDGHGSHVGSTAGGNFVVDPPFLDAEGTDNGITLGTISGVAPRANIVGLKVCAPSCGAADRVAAVDTAIELGLNALNHSIGTGGGSPWLEPVAVAFMNARAAGIMVQNSAGNSGPGAATAAIAGNAPWVTAVAASTHDRTFPDKFVTNMSGGAAAPPADPVGKSVSGEITAPIVWAGNYSNGDTNPEQCLNPFPAGTFNGEIVLCERGAIARVQKCINVRDGGAGGCILTNIPGGDISIVADPHVIPAIHIDDVSGIALKDWLAAGSGHAGTITGADTPIIDSSRGDWLAGFSSRGPYTGYDILAPNVSVPGVDIFAAGSDLAFENGGASVPGAYGMISGTSMSSPHATGSATLMMELHPDWTAAEILSAFMSTGQTAMVKEDGVSAADPYDYGGGRIRLPEAARAGLVLDETATNFAAADPALGGDPRTLNVAALVDDECLAACGWTRTVRATVDGTWEAAFTARDEGLTFSIEPSSFTLAAGDTQTLTINADVSALPLGSHHFGEVWLNPVGTRGSLATPSTVMQAAIVPSAGILPASIDIDAARNAGSILVTDLRTLPVTDLQLQAFGPTKGVDEAIEITGEFPNFDPYAGIATATLFFDVPNNTARFIVSTSSEDSPDIDLFVGRDDNGDGEISEDEERCNSGSSGSNEFCELNNPEAGSYWVTVLQFQASDPSATDESTVSTAIVTPSVGGLSAEGPQTVPPGESYDIRVLWDEEMKEGDMFFGAITIGTDAANPDNLGMIPVNLERIADDVRYGVDSTTAAPGDTLTYTIEVAPNFSTEDLAYEIEASIPDGFTLVDGSVTRGGVLGGDTLGWTVVQESLSDVPRVYNVTTSVEDPLCDTGFAGYVDLETFELFPDSGISGDTFAFSAFEGQNINFYGDQKSGMSFTDDGFAFFASTPGSEPWVNKPIPLADDPNDLAAMFWSDWEIVYDEASNRGVTLAVAGTDVSIIEYDDAEPWPAGSTGAHYDFELVITGFIDDSPGAYEVVMAYANIINARVDHGITAGVEDITGTIGTEYAYNDLTKFTNGLMVCYDFVGPNVDPLVLSYQVTVDGNASGGDKVSTLTNSVDNPGSATVSLDLAVFVEAAVDSDGDGVVDSADNCIDAANADQRDTDSDGYGNLCDGDFNQDGVVNWLDLGHMRLNYLSGDPDADLNGDGTVNAMDLGIIKSLFYAPPGPSGVAGP